jgi:hypothetical protein
MEKATVIFKNEYESKSIILNITYNKKAGDINVQLKAEPREKIKDVFSTNEFYARLTAILMDELGDIEQVN